MVIKTIFLEKELKMILSRMEDRIQNLCNQIEKLDCENSSQDREKFLDILSKDGISIVRLRRLPKPFGSRLLSHRLLHLDNLIKKKFDQIDEQIIKIRGGLIDEPKSY
jgi:hypothetical protein